MFEKKILSSFLVVLFLSALCEGADWPQWRGVLRDGSAAEKGLMEEWPSQLKKVWSANVFGAGYNSPAVVGNHLYVLGMGKKKEWLICYDLENSKQKWACSLGPSMSYKELSELSMGGCGCTPYVDTEQGFVYALSREGALVCCEITTGKVRWYQHMVTTLKGKRPKHGFTESPLIDGKKIIVMPGGRQTVVRLNRFNGAFIGATALGQQGAYQEASYSSMIHVPLARVQQYVGFTDRAVVGINAQNGAFLWEYTKPANTEANIMTPIKYLNTIFAASGHGVGAGCVHVTIDEEKETFEIKEIYNNKRVCNWRGGMVRFEEHIYGCIEPSMLACIDYKKGNIKWRQKTGRCSVALADQKIYYITEDGRLGACKADPKKYDRVGEFSLPKQNKNKNVAQPVISNGKIYVRDQSWIYCYQI